MSKIYTTTFCNCGHRVSDGKPINHECYILPTPALHAEMKGDMEKAVEILGQWKKRKQHRGVRVGVVETQ